MNELIEDYLMCRAAEESAKAQRLKAESALIAAVANDKPEGSKSVHTDRFKISVSNKLTRKLDHDAYLRIKESLPETLQFVIYKPEISVTILRHLEAVDPKLAAQCITSKPAKPSVEIKEVA